MHTLHWQDKPLSRQCGQELTADNTTLILIVLVADISTISMMMVAGKPHKKFKKTIFPIQQGQER